MYTRQATALCTIANFFSADSFSVQVILISKRSHERSYIRRNWQATVRRRQRFYAYTQSNKYYGWARIRARAWQERRVKHNDDDEEEEEVEAAPHSNRHFSPSVNIAAQSLCIHRFTWDHRHTLLARQHIYQKKKHRIAESQSKRFMYLYSAHTASVCAVWKTERVRQKGMEWNSATYTWAS